MKVLPFKIPKPEQESLVFQIDHEVTFYDQLHQHEEIQISYIREGSGSLVIGDTINTFSKNDVFIIGENVPHIFKSDPSDEKSLMLTLFFTKRSFGQDFFRISELNRILKILEEAEYGYKATSHQHLFYNYFQQLEGLSKIERIAYLLLILNLWVECEKSPLSSFIYRKKYSDDDGKRMRAVMQYAMEHFDEPISLDSVAEKANMSRNAFCRYFKKRTNKTFFQFLIEIRIENACKLLYSKKDLPISSISELCGFQNMANFNRKFKELKGIPPSQYRSEME